MEPVTPHKKRRGLVVGAVIAVLATIGITQNNTQETQTNNFTSSPSQSQNSPIPAMYDAPTAGTQETITETKHTPAQEPARVITPSPNPPATCAADHYINVDGNCVQSPTYAPSAPAGATAECRDGTYSFSQNRRGTCSHHGGVAQWL